MNQRKHIKAAVRTARRMLSRGTDPREVVAGLGEWAPLLTGEQRAVVVAAIRPEAHVLGRAVVDPNLSRSCGVARDELRRSASRATVVAVLKTPACSGCSHRRGNTCGLIGSGRPLGIVASIAGLPEGTADAAARALVASQGVSVGTAESIMGERRSPRQRVARLHRRAAVEGKDDGGRDIRDVQRSVRAAATLETTGAGPTIRAARRQGQPTVVNPDRGETPYDARMAGDARVARQAAKVAAAMRPTGMVIRQRRDPEEQRVVPGRTAHLVMPRRERTATPADASEDRQQQAQAGYEGLMRRTRSLLASGRVTGVQAGRLMGRFEQYRGLGIRPSPIGRRLERQIALLAGHPDE